MPIVVHWLFDDEAEDGEISVMHEEGCATFSDLVGLTTVRFPRNDIAARFVGKGPR